LDSQKGCARKKRNGSSACIITSMMPVIRNAEEGDLAAVDAIQRSCPEAAQWDPREYLAYDFRIATIFGEAAGFIVARRVASDECEILNLAVALQHRRKGVARALVEALRQNREDAFFLEVRESNRAAREFYKSLRFQEVNRRSEYYQSPLESAIVMKFHSC
jgi:ribosomal-protein-alanine N-acetyltransferase